MKFLLYISIFASALNCGSPAEDKATTSETSTPAIEQEVEQQNDVLVGSIQKQDLIKAPHATWFDPMYQSYEPGTDALETIKENINDYEIKVFMGTWCSDSKREIPKLYKLLELSDYDMDKLEMQAVRLDKTLPNDLQEEYDVHYVPTVIFYKDGEETGRFVEYPQEEFEEDIAKIVSGQDYKHSYE